MIDKIIMIGFSLITIILVNDIMCFVVNQTRINPISDTKVVIKVPFHDIYKTYSCIRIQEIQK